MSTVADEPGLRRLLAVDAACVLGWAAIATVTPQAVSGVSGAPHGLAAVATASVGLAAVAVLVVPSPDRRRRLLQAGGAVNSLGCLALLVMAPAPHTATLLLLAGGGLLTIGYLALQKRSRFPAVAGRRPR